MSRRTRSPFSTRSTRSLPRSRSWVVARCRDCKTGSPVSRSKARSHLQPAVEPLPFPWAGNSSALLLGSFAWEESSMRIRVKTDETTTAWLPHRCDSARKTVSRRKDTARLLILAQRACRLPLLISARPRFEASWVKEALPMITALSKARVNPEALNRGLWRTTSLDFLASESSWAKSDFEQSASLEPEMVFDIPSLPARSPRQQKSAPEAPFLSLIVSHLRR